MYTIVSAKNRFRRGGGVVGQKVADKFATIMYFLYSFLNQMVIQKTHKCTNTITKSLTLKLHNLFQAVQTSLLKRRNKVSFFYNMYKEHVTNLKFIVFNFLWNNKSLNRMTQATTGAIYDKQGLICYLACGFLTYHILAYSFYSSVLWDAWIWIGVLAFQQKIVVKHIIWLMVIHINTFR